MEDILKMENISKNFYGVYALKNVSFNVKKGEIHALVGENGAGKSTLMKVLSGVYPHGTYEGNIYMGNQECRFQNVRDAENAGISIIYQELNLVSEMDIGENIFLNRWPMRRGMIDYDSMYHQAEEICKELKIEENVRAKVKNLGIGMQQLVEIAKALSKKVDILVLDEPTASLTESEVDTLLCFLKELQKKGVTCIYISHKLNEVFQVSDRITVLRDGNTIGTYQTEEIDEAFVIKAMVGRELTERFPYRKRKTGEKVLEISDYGLTDPKGRKILKHINLYLRKGEILGIAGLMGAGRTELAMSLFGAIEGRKSGTVKLFGEQVCMTSPGDAIRKNIALLTENRKEQGLLLEQSVSENIVLASMRKILSHGTLDSNKQYIYAQKYVKELNIKVPSVQTQVKNLSGGNQQKVVLAKWLMTEPKILILDEPTRGIDVGAKFEIYNLMLELVEKGYSVIMISSELPEILGMSDRVIIMHEGTVSGELSREEATQEKVMMLATGGKLA